METKVGSPPMVRRTSLATRSRVDLLAERVEPAQDSSVNGSVTRGASRRRVTLISKPNFTSAGSTAPLIGAAER